MIRVKILTENDTYQGFIISGHANFDEVGYDIVCSAVSAISQAILMGLSMVDKGLDIDTSDGYLAVLLKEPTKESELLIKTLEVSIKNIADQYPLNVRVSRV